MMFSNTLLATALLALSAVTSSSATPAFGRGPISSVFAVPRGGGLFGGKKDDVADV